jgi:CMP-N-acetylneuraminic acid synthetase
MAMTKITAILPMRAGSTRIKNKNILKIGSKPLYAYILDTLLASNYIGEIIINTDIKRMAKKYKNCKRIITLQRPRFLQGNCSINLVIKDTLNRVQGEHFLQTHATNPLLSSQTIDSAISRYFKNLKLYDSLFSVTKIQKRFWDKDVKPVNHELNESPTTQNLEPYYEENSCIYIFSRASFVKNKNRIGRRPYMFETSLMESFDIDTKNEFKMARRILRK